MPSPMHGEPGLPPDFSHLRYVNPDAPKGGRLVQGVLGTFDSLNPFIVIGLPALGMRAPLVSGSNIISGYVVESLMARGYDEPFTLYGLVAQSVETDDARSYVTFTLDPAARFSDGKPVTAADVIFSWQLLRDHGRPNYRTLLRQGESGRSDRRARGPLRSRRQQRPRAAADPRPDAGAVEGTRSIPQTFEETSFAPMIGSGPYIVGKVDPGKSVTLVRNPDYWGRDLPINRGFWNFDEIRFDYYRDANSYHEAFKRGLFDLRTETDPGAGRPAYDFPALRDGRVVKEAFSSGLPKASFFFVFNTRRTVFADIRVREAIALLFDFEWINHNLFFDLYRRSGELFRGLRAFRARPPGRCARARAAGAVSRRGARRRARRHLVAAGRATAPAAIAPSCAVRSRCWPPPATSCAAPSWSRRADRRAAHLRDHGGHPGR